MTITAAAVTPSRAAAERVTADPVAAYLTPGVVADARRSLGTRLAATRKAVGITQVQLAVLVPWSRSTIANVEKARQSAPREFWLACDMALGARGLLLAEWARTDVLARRLRDQAMVELVRQRLAQSPPRCVCRELRRLVDLADSPLSLGISLAAVVREDGAGHE